VKKFIKDLLSGFIWSTPAVVFLLASIGLLFKIHTFHPWIAIMCFVVVILGLVFSITTFTIIGSAMREVYEDIEDKD